VVLDDTLMGPQAAEGVRAEGALLVNSALPSSAWSGMGARVLAVDAGAIARVVLGRPMVNTAMMGALVAVSGAVGLDAALRAVQSEMHAALAEKNGDVLRRCHDLVKDGRNG
jgi:pyruvate ferredoxin oxidoreductase gamma subunit